MNWEKVFFVARQQRITLDEDHFYIDLVFYNRLTLFCANRPEGGKLTHQDIGQMQMYVNYYKRTQMVEGENEPIGILLVPRKNKAVVKFTLPEGQKQIYISRYIPLFADRRRIEKLKYYVKRNS